MRQYFAKSESFRKAGPGKVGRVVALLNGRPRKTLSYRSPDEVFAKPLRNLPAAPAPCIG